MVYEEILNKLYKNEKSASEEAIRLLSKIADNILKDPSNLKLRTLQKNNATISKKILAVKGASECLNIMGFKETSTTFTMPPNASLNNLQEFKNTITKSKTCGISKSSTNGKAVSNTEVVQNGPCQSNTVGRTNITVNSNTQNELKIKRIVLPPLVYNFANPFLKRLELYFHNILQHENKDLQKRARRLVPLVTLEENAQKRLRVIQEHIKKDKLQDPEISIQDTLILELLKWFKEVFFSWVDSPECLHCKGETTFSHMSTDSHLLVYTDRVELHRCKTCNQFTPFPRYNDLNILLETRRGRCGEWANTFTLFCRSMGWDSRFIVEEGDHVWTEVYSVTQKRWLHCDPCENVCDSPLIYESGWNKKISYVIAYSSEEVQDVTWRYSSHHKEVLKRRNNCSETELLNALFKLRSIRQKGFSETRKKYLTSRLLCELVEFLTERKPNDDDYKGRASGSSVWRLARGELQEGASESKFIWHINDSEIINNEVTVRYSASLDRYEYVSGNKKIKEVSKWNEGAFEHSGLFRKEEKDWKMVYLTRREGEEIGKISWKIALKDSKKHIDSVLINFSRAVFENGAIKIQICSDNTCVLLKDDELVAEIKDFHGATTLTIEVTLSGGKGDVAWQHAQLFRQSSDSNDYPFSLNLRFK